MAKYGIGIAKNRFELVDIDEEDPLELLIIREREKEAQKKTRLSEKQNKSKEPTLKTKGAASRKGFKGTHNLKAGCDENSMLRDGKVTNQINCGEESGDIHQTTGITVESEAPIGNSSIEKELKELTLDEWKSMHAPRQKPHFNVRKAGEGEDLTLWKDMYALQKKKEGEKRNEEVYNNENREHPQRVGRSKHIPSTSAESHFKDNLRGRVCLPGRELASIVGGPQNPFRGGRKSYPIFTETGAVSAGKRRTWNFVPKVDDFPSLD